MVLFWQIEVLGDWSAVFKTWEMRPLNLRTRNRKGKRTGANGPPTSTPKSPSGSSARARMRTAARSGPTRADPIE